MPLIGARQRKTGAKLEKQPHEPASFYVCTYRMILMFGQVSTVLLFYGVH